MPPIKAAMNAAQFREALNRLKLTPYGAAPFLGISRRQSLRYAANGHVPQTIAKLLDMLLRHGAPRDWLEK